MSLPTSLSDQLGTALITGASSGIGAVYAERLAARGHDLILVARDQQRLLALAGRLRAETGVKVEIMAADLNKKADLMQVEQRLRTDASISMLVNNAGIASNGSLLESDIDSIEAMIQLNIVAVTRLAAAAAANFAAAGRGQLINIASVVALLPEMFNASYSATKAFVLSFSQTLHKELSSKGVQVQVVLPGITRTEIWQRSGLDMHHLREEMIMEASDMVDAALTGLDSGELVTIPSLPDPADWQALVDARGKLAPNLSHKQPASRYRKPA